MPGKRWITTSALVAATATATMAAPTSIVVGSHVAKDGSLGGPVLVEIERGRIASIGAAPKTPPTGTMVFKGVLAPGIVDAFSGVGLSGSNVDNIKAIASDLTALDAIDPTHVTFAEARAAGVTSALVGPEPTNPISGVSVAVSTHTPDGKLDVLNDEGPLVLATGRAAVDTAFGPTSRGGILYEIRDAFGNAPDELVERAAAGDHPCVAYCPAGDDAAAVIQALGEFDVTPAIIHSADALDLSEDVAGYGAPFIVGPYGWNTPPETLAGAGFLQRADVPIVIHGDSGRFGFDHIRLTAAMAAKYGLSPEAARLGFTSTAAELAGIAEDTGSLAEGLRADLVVWSADPLRPDAKPIAVWIEGELVHRMVEGNAR